MQTYRNRDLGIHHITARKDHRCYGMKKPGLQSHAVPPTMDPASYGTQNEHGN